MSAHAKLSPSSAYRWSECTASVKALAEADIPQTTSPAAEEGSRAHALAELCLLSDIDPMTVEGDFDDEMRHHIVEYIKYVKHCDFEVFIVEKKLRLFYDKDGSGTCDIVGIKGKQLHIIDLKYGQGVFVVARDNLQLLIYAISALKLYNPLFKFDEIIITIYQPRLENIASWSYSIAELQRIEADISKRAAITSTTSAQFRPSEDTCKFCDLKPTCKALDEHLTEIISAEFTNLDEPKQIDDARIKIILDNKKLITSWLKEVETHVMSTLQEGKTFPGYKIVAGRGSRSWADTVNLVNLLNEEAFENIILSPAKFEKYAKKNKLEKSSVKNISNDIIHIEGKEVLAPVEDKRPAVTQITFEKYKN